MRMTTIWTIPGMALDERLRRTREAANRSVAAHLPRKLRYWVAMQEIARATVNEPNIPATTLDTILMNLDAKASA